MDTCTMEGKMLDIGWHSYADERQLLAPLEGYQQDLANLSITKSLRIYLPLLGFSPGFGSRTGTSSIKRNASSMARSSCGSTLLT
jgi:hypothetical protein